MTPTARLREAIRIYGADLGPPIADRRRIGRRVAWVRGLAQPPEKPIVVRWNSYGSLGAIRPGRPRAGG